MAMGIASAFGKNDFTDWLKSHKSAIGQFGVGLAQGRDLGEGIAMAGAGAQQGSIADAAYMAAEAEKAQREADLNETIAYLQKSHPDLALAIDAGMPLDLAWNEANKRSQPTDRKPIEINGQLVDPVTLKVLGDFRTPDGAGGGVEYGVNPVYGRLEDGTMGMGVIGKDGTLKRIDSEGFQPLGPYDTNALKAAGTAFGKGTGGAQFDAPGAKLIADQTIKALDDIRAEKKGMEEQFGSFGLIPQQMTPAWPGSDKAKFQVAVQRGTDRAFLEAREMLRGGGQITDFESKKAETAITSMQIAMEKGDKAQFEKALDDFEQAVKDGVAKLEQQASAMPGYGGGSTPAGGSNYVFDPATGKLVPQ